jgi:serine/threonine-protein kinase RsbW
VAEPNVFTRPAGALPLRTCERTFSAIPGQVSHARRFLADLVGDSELSADVITCLSELATNAVIHSDSRKPGGTFSVRVAVGPGLIRVEVMDDGGAWRLVEPPGDGQRGRGLVIVAAFATCWGITTCTSGRTAWFEFHRDAVSEVSTVS